MVLIRDATEEDIPWLCELAKSSYADLIENYDEVGAEKWIRACIASPLVHVVRGDGVAAFATYERPPWSHDRYCDLLHVFGKATEPLETVKVVQEIDRRRLADGVQKFYIGSIYRDLSVIGRWLRGRQLPAGYVIEE